jgi:nucleotide-binding universal stress UspA family protein
MNASKASIGEGAVFAATDFSAPADEALRRAHARAVAQAAPLVVCHVVPNVLPVNMLFPQRTVDLGSAQLDLQHRALQLLTERTCQLTGRASGDFVTLIGNGTPYSSIIEHAEGACAGVIVLGERGTSGIERVLLGSVADRVLRYADCPVLIARAARPTSRILVATDLSDPSLPALAASADEARRTGAEVIALYCFAPLAAAVGAQYGVPSMPSVPLEVVRQAREATRARLAEAVQQAGLSAEVRVVDGPAAATIVATAEEVAADLIVIGTRGRTGWRRVVLGSVAEAVLRNAKSSVLAVRLSDRQAL